MAEMYCYVPNAAVGNAVDCGLKLSEWNSGKVKINGIDKKYIIAYLNPRDNLALYNSAEHTCLKFDVDNRYCYVADGCLGEITGKQPILRKIYEESIVPLNEYVFGMHRLPECLVVTTIIGGNIHVLNKKKDSPVILDNSEELYINNIIEEFREKNENFNDALLCSFYEQYASENGFDKISDYESGLVVYINKKGGKPVILRMPGSGQEWFRDNASE